MKRKDYPTKDILSKFFRYDPLSGILYRRLANSEKECKTLVGGYLTTRFNGERYLVHILCFILHYGYQPEIVEHKDTNKLNNKVDNLRPASYCENNSNVGLRKDNTSGYKGVYKHGSSWRAQIYCKGKKYAKSGFKTPEDANEYLTTLRKELHGEFARDS